MTISSPKVLGTYEDKYGESVKIHRTRHGIRRLRTAAGPAIEANRTIAPLVAKEIKRQRILRGWTLIEMATRLGWLSGNPKERVWALENCNSRGEGVRLGTLYHVSEVFGINLTDLLPSQCDIRSAIQAKT